MAHFRNYRTTDPFAVQALPRSYYFPSPNKDVDKGQAIRNPYNARNVSKRTAAEEQFLLGSNTYKASALPDVRTLSDEVPVKETSLKDIKDSDDFEEGWPGSEGSGNVTRHTEMETTGFSEGDFSYVQNTLRTAEQRTKLKDVSNKDQILQEGQPESVLQRYIERFRYSAPKPREERLKEREKSKREFWWLQKDSPIGGNTKIQREYSNELDSYPCYMKPKLTKEALQAMDEESQKLQDKADKLLSQSQLSFASSGPIVSTVGLGTSSSVSDLSAADDQVPYRPAFVNVQERLLRTQLHTATNINHQTKPSRDIKSSPEDVLARWRLRRKMEDAQKASFGHGQPRQAKPSSKLDPRLEDFRKKLFEQKALIIQHDIDYERQKMKLHLGDEDEEMSQKVKVQECSRPVEDCVDLKEDPVLKRLHQAMQVQQQTNGKDHNELDKNWANGSHTRDAAVCVSGGDNNTNNMETPGGDGAGSESELGRHLNTNDRGDMNVCHDDIQSSDCFAIDTFQSQVVCDPRSKVFNLQSSGKRVVKNVLGERHNNMSNSDSSNRNETKHRICDKDIEHSGRVTLGSAVPNVEQQPKQQRQQQQYREWQQQESHQQKQQHHFDQLQHHKQQQQQQHKHQNHEPQHHKQQYEHHHHQQYHQQQQQLDQQQHHQQQQKIDQKQHHQQQQQFDQQQHHQQNQQKQQQQQFRTGNERKAKKSAENVETKVMSKDIIDDSSAETNNVFHQVLEAEKPNEDVETRERFEDDAQSVSSGGVSCKRKDGALKVSREKQNRLNDTERKSDIDSRARSPSDTRLSKKKTKKNKVKGASQKGSDNDAFVSVDSDSSTTGRKVSSMGSHKDICVNRNEQGIKKTIGITGTELSVSEMTKEGTPASTLLPSGSQSPLGKVGRRQPVHTAIGQAVADHLFDGSALISSVDSWTSVIPQSPAQSKSLQDTVLTSPSPSRRHGTPPLQSTPISKESPLPEVDEDSDQTSDGEFEEDFLLILLRQQRKKYTEQLRLIEAKLHELQDR